MADEDPRSRRGKLRELRQKRQKQPGYQGNRQGLRGLWANLAAEQSEGGARPRLGKGAERGKDEGGGLPKAPLLRQLLQNPKVRHTIVGWLGEGGPGDDLADKLGTSDLGLERLSSGEEITSSSTPEEIARYRQQLENRADWLEAALEETLMELERVGRAQVASAATKGPRVKKALTKKKAAAKKATSKPAAVKTATPKKRAAAKARRAKKA